MCKQEAKVIESRVSIPHNLFCIQVCPESKLSQCSEDYPKPSIDQCLDPQLIWSLPISAYVNGPSCQFSSVTYIQPVHATPIGYYLLYIFDNQ